MHEQKNYCHNRPRGAHVRRWFRLSYKKNSLNSPVKRSFPFSFTKKSKRTICYQINVYVQVKLRVLLIIYYGMGEDKVNLIK